MQREYIYESKTPCPVCKKHRWLLLSSKDMTPLSRDVFVNCKIRLLIDYVPDDKDFLIGYDLCLNCKTIISGWA